jgi:thymidylate synthase (FAD)
MDNLFRVEVISRIPYPQQVIYVAMHQDYAEEFVWSDLNRFPSEEKCGELVVKHLLAGNRGHYGPLEHPQIVLNCGWFPHSTMQQLRTHRVGVSFDCQSFRYTGRRLIKAAQHFGADPEFRHVEEVVYLRPVGSYTDRSGDKYDYSQMDRYDDLVEADRSIVRYAQRIEQGFSEEHARGLIPFDTRQHWVMSLNLRSLMHLLLIRGKKDAQLECQQLCQLILPHFEVWCPQVYQWFMENLWLRGRLAP